MYYFLRRKFLLLVFKIKRFGEGFFSIRKLDYDNKPLFIYVQNIREYETRAKSSQKEPETVRWIESFAHQCSIFYDIGANIGAYSLVAAANDLKVYAFEPSYPNFYTLNKNISLNKFDGKIEGFPVILSRETRVGMFNYFETTSGTARCYYGREDKIYGYQSEAIRATLVYSLDDFIKTFDLPYPDMIKIDVDGGEYQVIQGALKTLQSPHLKTILIEIDSTLDQDLKIVKCVEDQGFVVSEEHPINSVLKNVIFVKE